MARKYEDAIGVRLTDKCETPDHIAYRFEFWFSEGDPDDLKA